MSLWKSYLGLSAQKKGLLGLALIGWSGLGIYVTDRAEKKFGLEPTDEDRQNLEKMVPKISVVDRDQFSK